MTSLHEAATSQLGRQTWWERARAGAPKSPLPGGAEVGLRMVTAPAAHKGSQV